MRRLRRLDGRRLLAGAALGALIACARMGSPPGGPEDKVPPKLLGTVPESLGIYPDWHRDAEFRFDEVVSEGGTPSQGLGTGDLERLILLSPGKAVPVIHWKRDRITVHPREGWRPNRTYRLQLLPGLQDLRRNKSDTTVVLTFSTGGELPTDTVAGLAIDWVQGRVAPAALVELILQPDSLVYRAVADSSGRFAVGPLPRGRWEVFGVLDQNKNLQRDRRESYDSTFLAQGEHRASPLWLIPRDTVGPKLQSIVANDSVSATLTFTQPLDPTQRFDSLAVVFRRQKDSVAVPFRSLLPKAMDDSLQKQAQATADSIRRAADTTHQDTTARKAAPKPPSAPPGARPGGARPSAAKVDAEADSILKTRPALFDRLVLRVDTAFTPEGRYELIIPGIRSAAGVAGEARSTLVIPKPKPPAASPDTLRAPPDSARAPADSAKKRPAPAKQPSP